MTFDNFFTPSEQMIIFLYSLILGGVFGVVFDLFRIFRAFIPHKNFFVAIEDIAFMIFWGVSVVVFSIEVAGGEIRFFCLAGTILGFSLYILTLGQIVISIARGVSGAVKAVFRWIYRTFVLKIARVFVLLYQMLKPVFVNIYLIFMKPLINIKNRLKNRRRMVYNNSMKPVISGMKKHKMKRPQTRTSYGKGSERVEKRKT